jgi:hypothetical protein
VEGLHHLHDLHYQGVCSVAGVFLDILSTYATNITVQGVTVWAARGQDLLFLELRKVDQAPIPGSHGLVWQVNILLESFVTSNSNGILSGLPRLLQNLHKLFGIDHRDLMGLLRSWLTRIGWVAMILSTEALLLELNCSRGPLGARN